MLRLCRTFSTIKTKKVITNCKTTKLMDNFFKKNDKNGKIREALRSGDKELKKQIKKIKNK
tara:strand:+ start:560 stop:742 length:183 start_codon:yes stop_codon:yes gene_type:complete